MFKYILWKHIKILYIYIFLMFLDVYLQDVPFINSCFSVMIIFNTYIRRSLIICLNIFLWKQSYENTLYLYFYMEIHIYIKSTSFI